MSEIVLFNKGNVNIDVKEKISQPPQVFREPPTVEEVVAIFSTLSKEATPQEWIRYRPVGNNVMIPYVPIVIIRGILDRVFGINNWGYDVIKEELITRKSGAKDWLVTVKVWGIVKDNGEYRKIVLGEGVGGSQERDSQVLDISDFRESAISKAISRVVGRKLFWDVYERGEKVLTDMTTKQPRLSLVSRLNKALDTLGFKTIEERKKAIGEYYKEKTGKEYSSWNEIAEGERAMIVAHFEKQALG